MSENKQNKKRIIISGVKVISFILVFVILLQVLSATVFSKAAGASNSKYRFAYNFVNEVEGSIDIVALGNSNMYSAFTPLKLWDKKGYTSTVVASARQTAAMSYTMLLDVLEKQSPKFVILETDMFYEGEEFNPNLDSVKTKKKRLPAIPYVTDDQLTTDIQNYFTVFLLHDRWKKMLFNSSNTDKDAGFNHGYYFNKDVKKLKPNDNMKYTQNIDELPEETVLYLDKMIKLCDKNDIQLIFFSTPSLANWSYARHNGVDVFAKENNIPFLDFNTLDDYEINYKKDFRDKGIHMNYYGAKKITSYIGNYIKENYPNALEDKRKNEDFSYWYDDKQKFIDYHEIKTF